MTTPATSDEIAELVRRLHLCATDYDESQIPDEGEPLNVRAGDLRAAADALEQQARDLAAAEERIEFRVRQTDEVLAANRQLRLENAELRERVGEEIAQFCENEPIHSWTGRILAERIRALTKSGK